MNQKSLDKKKHKELDIKKFWDCKTCGTKNNPDYDYCWWCNENKTKIERILTQQRTELLEDIKKEKEIKFKDIINSANMLLGINGFRFTFDGEMLGLIDERLIKNEIKKL